MKAALKRFVAVLDDVGMFLLTAVCVFVSSYVSTFQGGGAVQIDFSIARTLIALVIALLVTAVIELKGIVNAKDLESAAKAKEGRRKNAWLRILLSVVLGLSWPYLLEAAQRILGIGK